MEKGLTSEAWALVHELLHQGGSINGFFDDPTPTALVAAGELMDHNLAEVDSQGLSLIVRCAD